MESQFRDKFLTPLNLQGIIDMAFEEKKELKFLLTGVGKDDYCETSKEKIRDVLKEYTSIETMVDSVTPKYDIVKKRKEMNQMLETAKPYFYEIAGIEPVKNPKLLVKRGNFATSISIISPYLPYIALTGIFVGGAAFVLGAGAIASAGVGAALFAALSGRAYKKVLKSVKKYHSFSLPTNICDRIYIASGQRSLVFNIILHEYTHNVCFKTQMPKDICFKEGIASAMAQKAMINMGKEQPACEAFARLQKLSYAIDTYAYIIKKHSGDNKQNNMPVIREELVPYVCGATMFNLAEYNYGSKIYKEAFNKDFRHIIS
ncbi:MAG: hypothetical protein AABX27_02355 [Nanoarchaeota archaeon]